MTSAALADPDLRPSPPAIRRVQRSADHRIVGGVVSGLAEHLHMDNRYSRNVLRLAFIALAFSGGLGVVLYGAYWIVLPLREEEAARGRVLWRQYVACGCAAVVAIVVVSQTFSLNGFFVPILLAALGGALVWRQGSENQREHWARMSTSSLRSTARGRTGVIRLVTGAALVITGGVLVLTRGSSVDEIASALVVVAVVSVGFALISGPLWVGLVSDLSAERRELIRAQERADLAARVHDSVLQTLALIQRNAASPREVARLARGQERELRSLLYGRPTATGRFAAAVNDAVGEVEDAYAVGVDAVVVGDVEMDERFDALVQAAREAMVNAAKHAGVDTISLYAEADASEVVVYVRDRGQGFDPDDVPADRQGLRGSIRDRVERHGGTTRVRSRPGQGTEVELRLERDRA
ncbi:MAG: ATP-binding protein [bacterium]